MKSVTPEAIKASRVYFTEFDRVTFSQVAWTPSDVAGIRRNLERKLKLLTLVKGHVVVAASHLLESELALGVLLPHPRLFSEAVIVPALRSDFTGFEHFLDSKIAEGKESDHYQGSKRRQMAQMLDSTTAMAVRWDVKQTSDWFKQRLVNDINDEGSLIRSCLRGVGVVPPLSLAEQIRAVPKVSRKDIYLLAKNTNDKKLWDLVCNYADFLYYLTGAKAVRSEGVLPQENLLDFSLSDMANGRTRLSEMEVFFKIFVDLIKTTTHTHFPTNLLDAISMEDVLDLHSVAVSERFVEKYNSIQEKTKAGLSIRDPERLVLLMQELESFERQLHSEYSAAIEKELPRHLREQHTTQAAKFLNATACLLIPPWGTVNDIQEFLVSGIELTGKRSLVSSIARRTRNRIKAWCQALDNSRLEDKPVLIRFARHLQEQYARALLDP